MNQEIIRLDSIATYHKIRGLKAPAHPLISLIDYSQIVHSPKFDHVKWLYGYYSISMKRDVPGKFRYGQKSYDFDGGLMSFFAPNQIMSLTTTDQKPVRKPSGWILLIHPDFLWNTPLAKAITQYEFFDYSITEALFLSEREEETVASIFNNIELELNANTDKFSQTILISQIELLLNYAQRFYERQFITRKINNHELLTRFENVLHTYFTESKMELHGLPSVQEIADQLNITPNYLSSSLKQHTGLNAQQHIHDFLVAKAKEKLSTSALSVSEIAYELGFEHPQSFSKFFKSKTNQSPLEFRAEFSAN